MGLGEGRRSQNGKKSERRKKIIKRKRQNLSKLDESKKIKKNS